MVQDLKVTGVRGVGEVLGIPKTKAAVLVKEPWFPPRGPDGSWSTAEILAAVEARNAGRAPPVVHEARSSAGVGLRSQNPTERQTAAAEIAARYLEKADQDGDFDGVAKALASIARSHEELRRGETDAVALAKEKGTLIERDAAKACMGELASRFVRALERLEARLSTQVEAWISDETFRTGTAEARQREVRAWASKQAIAGRNDEAGELEKMIAVEIADRKGA